MPTYLSRSLDPPAHNSSQPMPSGPVEFGIVFDRSSSMMPLREAALAGFNTLLGEQRKLKFPARFSLSFFNNKVEKIHNGVPIAEAPVMEESDYFPNGGTALFDGIGSMIEQIGECVDPSPHISRALIAILTDGHENASTRFSKSDIFDLITFRRNACNWQFLFLGVGGNTVPTGLSLGIQRSNILQFNADPESIRKVMRALSNTFKAYQLGQRNFAALLKS
jgi:hypothetical protein